MRSMAINSGAIVGPALGAALYHIFSFHIILYISIGTYAILGTILTLIYFSPPESTSFANSHNEVKQNKYSSYIYYPNSLFLLGNIFTMGNRCSTHIYTSLGL